MNRLWQAIRSLTTPGGAERIPSGPNPADVVTAAEIEAATGGSPIGSGRRNGSGTAVDVGTLVICEWQLTNGDEFLVTLIRAKDRQSAELAVERQSEEMKPLGGVGERSLIRVQKYSRGKTEIGVTALRGSYVLSLTHTSSHGASDPEPLINLLRLGVSRLG